MLNVALKVARVQNVTVMSGFLRDMKTPCDFFGIQAYFGMTVPGWGPDWGRSFL